MNLLRPKYLKYVVLGLISALVVTCWPRKEKPQGHPRDYAEIKESGILHAATEYNSISFYVDEDTVSGFHYELIEAFARDKGLQVQVSPVMSFNQRLEGLADGTYDVVAYGIPATSELKDSLLLTSPIILSKQVLVQRKVGENDSLAIRSQLDLAGKTLNVVKGSPSILRIRNLSNEIGDTIYVNEIEKYGSEQLIAMVAHGDIDYAVCDEGIARMAVDSLPQLDINTAIRDINTAISFTQFSRPTRQPEYMAIRLPEKRRIPVRLSQILRETITGFLPSSPSLLKITVTSCTTGTVRVEQLVVYELYNSSRVVQLVVSH